MNKCLRVTLFLKSYSDDLVASIQKTAKKLKVEGTIQSIDKKTLKLIACGKSEAVDLFMDQIYKGHKNEIPLDVEVEPFLRDRDYRGVFRIIE